MAEHAYMVKSMTVGLKIGTAAETTHEVVVTGVVENESHDESSFTPASPAGARTDVGPSTWSVAVGYGVSHDPASFHRILRDNAGEAAVLTIEPDPLNDPGRKLSWDVVLTPAGASMNVGAWADATATLPVQGQPRYTDPAE